MKDSRWMTAMRRGDFEAAWEETDRLEAPRRAQFRGAEGSANGAEYLQWDGTPFDGRVVLVQCEHGLGDTIMFLRFAPMLSERARKVIVRLQPALLSLFDGMPGIDEALDAWTVEPAPPHDVAIECMELAYAFRSTPATLPARVPYLPVNRIRAAHPLITSGRRGARKIALVWAASDWDTSRSIPLVNWEPLGRITGAEFYSLQQGEAAAAVLAAPFPLTSLSDRTREIRAAAAAMLEMDLVITVDNMVAHLAGALGRPVWVLLKNEPDWRWMCNGTTSPWYPTMRLFRQPTAGDWDGAIAEVVSALERP